MSTSKTSLLIDYVRNVLLMPGSYFQVNGYSTQVLYRRNLPQKKNPTYPALVFAWEPDIREITTLIDRGILTISVYTNTYIDTDVAGNSLADELHLLTAGPTGSSKGTAWATGTVNPLYIYKCHDTGGPSEPIYNRETNTWTMALNFEVWVG